MYQFQFLGKKQNRRTLNVCQWLHRLWQRLIYCERRTIVCVPIRPVMVPIWSVVMVHLARRGFQDCTVYWLLPPTLVYFAVQQPWLFSIYCLTHCTTTRTPFSELSQALCWSAIVFSVSRAVISLLPKHTLMSFITGLAYFVSWGTYNNQSCFPLLDAVSSELLTTAPEHLDKHIRPHMVYNLCCLC